MAEESLLSAETQVPQHDVTGIDSFMEEWASPSFLITEESFEAPRAAEIVVAAKELKLATTEENSDKDNHLVDLLMAGLVMGTVAGTGKRTEEDE